MATFFKALSTDVSDVIISWSRDLEKSQYTLFYVSIAFISICRLRFITKLSMNLAYLQTAKEEYTFKPVTSAYLREKT